jgi:CheY-like chemotaxis protein
MPATILLVEDEADIRMLTRMWLEAEGYTVREADDGQMAWESIAQTAPDIVLTDMAMPVMDGAELCGLIKSTEETSGIPVVILTSHTEVATRMAGTDAGADAYISKYDDRGILRSRIEALLAAGVRQSEVVRREVETAELRTLGQTVITLAHHLNNSLMSISATAEVIDSGNTDHAERLKSVCTVEVRKMFRVMGALREMAEAQELKTTRYVGTELMFDLESDLKKLGDDRPVSASDDA